MCSAILLDVVLVRVVFDSMRIQNSLGHGFWGDAKPGIVSQPHPLIILGEDLVSLRPVAVPALVV